MDLCAPLHRCRVCGRLIRVPFDDDTLLATLGHLNYAEFTRETARWSGASGEIAEVGGVLMVASGSTFPVGMNAAMRIDDRVPGIDVVAAADEWFGSRERGHSIYVRDTAADEDLAFAVDAAGLLTVVDVPEMVCRERLPDVPPPEGIELRWVDDDAGVAQFVDVVAASYQTLGLPAEAVRDSITDHANVRTPNVFTVLAVLDGRPVGAAQTLLSHGIAGIYWVAALEEVRGRGVGEAVARAVTNRAFDEGARANSLQASPMGEAIYARMGYETLHRYRTATRFEPAPT